MPDITKNRDYAAAYNEWADSLPMSPDAMADLAMAEAVDTSSTDPGSLQADAEVPF